MPLIGRRSFDSLRAGKCLQSSKARCLKRISQTVSIPFARESVSKDQTTFSLTIEPHYTFPFPSNGKVSPKDNHHLSAQLRNPFRFPSRGKVSPKNITDKPVIDGEKFRFPSTGKACPKVESKLIVCGYDTMFRFPSTGKAYPKYGVGDNAVLTVA